MLVKVNVAPAEEVEQAESQVVVLYLEGSRDTGASKAEASLDSQPAHLLRRNLNVEHYRNFPRVGQRDRIHIVFTPLEAQPSLTVVDDELLLLIIEVSRERLHHVQLELSDSDVHAHC